MQSFDITFPSKPISPILLSIPHSGILFPEKLKKQYKKELIAAPDDTDWLLDKLYDFAPAMGITVIRARYNRWVIDLNRNPDNKPLYSDGRISTGLCPSSTFLGIPIYTDGRAAVDPTEVTRRLATYYQPYHAALQSTLANLQKQFGNALLWDCHSIRQWVPTIRKEKFPDLILGSAGETSASSALIKIVLQQMHQSAFSTSHNDPFKGGYITRHYGQPHTGRHALQLEMSKIKYMDDKEVIYHPKRANKIKVLLQNIFDKLIEQLTA